MKIEDLYLELGRAMTEKIQENTKAQDIEKVMQAQVAAMQANIVEARNKARTKQERIQQHIDELQEAIKLASEGTDPCLAKLTAKESLEERREAQKLIDSMVTSTKVTQNTYYGNNLGNVNVGAQGVAGAACYAPYFTHPITVQKGGTGMNYTGTV